MAQMLELSDNDCKETIILWTRETNEEIESLRKEIEDIKMNKLEILELTIITKEKYLKDGLSSKWRRERKGSF